MTYSLSNNCTKNYYNRTLTVQVIVEDVVTWIFLETQCSSDYGSELLECLKFIKQYADMYDYQNIVIVEDMNFVCDSGKQDYK